MKFVRYTTHAVQPAIIDPGTIRAFLPSQHGNGFTLLVLDGGTKVHVSNGGPDVTFRDANPGAEEPLPGFVRRDTAPESPTRSSVNDFSELMEARLASVPYKGGREGWLGEPAMSHVRAAMSFVNELDALLLHGRVDRHTFERLTADCANRLMMARDSFITPTL